MARTLSDILTDANATLDLEAALPTSTELVVRQNYANQAVWDAATNSHLNELSQEILGNTSTLLTHALPSNFHEFKHNPMILTSTGTWQEYEEIDPEQKYDKGSGDKYCYVLGNPSEGKHVVFNNPTALATYSMIIQRYPSGMLTLTDVCELADPTYITRKVESYVLYSRGDDRFPTAEARAEVRLQNLTSRDMKTPGGQGRDTTAKFSNPLG